MNKPLGSATFHLLLLLNRLTLGFFFAYHGFTKVQAELNQGFGNFYRGEVFQGMQPTWLPDILAAPFAYALPWAETVLGVLLMIGLAGTVAALLISLLLLAFSIAMCVGGALFWFQPQPGGQPYHYNLVYLTLALLLTVTGPGRISLDALWRCRKGRGRAVEGRAPGETP